MSRRGTRRTPFNKSPIGTQCDIGSLDFPAAIGALRAHRLRQAQPILSIASAGERHDGDCGPQTPGKTRHHPRNHRAQLRPHLRVRQISQNSQRGDGATELKI